MACKHEWLFDPGIILFVNLDSAVIFLIQPSDGSLSIRRGKYKLELCPGSGGWSDPVPGKEDPEAPRFQLYDLSVDISERRNVIEEHLELATGESWMGAP